MNKNLVLQQITPEFRIKQLFQDVEINPQYPLIRYFRSGPEMISMARIYEKEGDYERAFMLYYKYITLFLEKLPDIPYYKDIPTLEKITVKNVLKEILPKAEVLKKKIYNKYLSEYNHFLDEQKRLADEIEKSRPEIDTSYFLKSHLSNTSNNTNNYSNINTSITDNKELPDFFGASNDTNLNSKLSNNTNTLIGIPSRDLKPKNLIDVSPTYSNGLPPPLSYSSFNNTDHNSPGFCLRTVRVPKNLVAIFLSLAEANTDKNVETGGHLFGKLSQNVFTITHLVIPKQAGKSDSFTAIGEEEMVYFKESKNLLTLGWIHTHPSQTAFLSSVDLHNQHPNQQLLPEYIAIVCAPTHKEVKYFTITPDYGMNILATCKEQGFHYHSQNPPLYEECKHIVLEPHLDVVVEDMRRVQYD